MPVLRAKYPAMLGDKLAALIGEYQENRTPEARFAHAIDKMDALVHELPWPQDWAPKGFDESNVRKWFEPAFKYSPTFMRYFEATIEYLQVNRHFCMPKPI